MTKPRYRLEMATYAWLLFVNANYTGIGREMYLLPRYKFQSGRWHP